MGLSADDPHKDFAEVAFERLEPTVFVMFPSSVERPQLGWPEAVGFLVALTDRPLFRFEHGALSMS